MQRPKGSRSPPSCNVKGRGTLFLPLAPSSNHPCLGEGGRKRFSALPAREEASPILLPSKEGPAGRREFTQRGDPRAKTPPQRLQVFSWGRVVVGGVSYPLLSSRPRRQKTPVARPLARHALLYTLASQPAQLNPATHRVGVPPARRSLLPSLYTGRGCRAKPKIP